MNVARADAARGARKPPPATPLEPFARTRRGAADARVDLRHRIAGLTVLLSAASGCLPADDRPEPGSVLVNVQRSATAAGGFVTDDGWSISFDRFVTAIGRMGLDGDDCVDYSNARYDRLYDFTVAETSKVALHYGLGPCTLPFSIRWPSESALLMAGVTELDREIMRSEAMDALNEEEPSRIGMVVIGRAERSGETKTFAWLVRRRHELSTCYAPARDAVVSSVDLEAEDALVRELVVRPEELFRRTPATDAAIEFDRIAAADSDGDGEITLEELAGVTVSFEDVAADVADELGALPAEEVVELLSDESLGKLVFDILSWRVVAFAGSGECELGDRSRDWQWGP